MLERPEFADYWALKWSDLLRVKSEFPINLWPNAVQAYHRWVWTCLRDNKSYDQFAREIITASGSNFRVPQVNFYRSVQNRQPEDLAQAVALTFMGTRADKWSEEQRKNMGVFFSQIGYKNDGRMEGGDCLFRSAKRRPPRRPRGCFPTAPRRSFRSTGILAKSSPIG